MRGWRSAGSECEAASEASERWRMARRKSPGVESSHATAATDCEDRHGEWHGPGTAMLLAPRSFHHRAAALRQYS